jgi:hypothetical protein
MAVNVAEYAPFVGEAVDTYLRAYIDVAGTASGRNGLSSMPGLCGTKIGGAAPGEPELRANGR